MKPTGVRIASTVTSSAKRDRRIQRRAAPLLEDADAEAGEDRDRRQRQPSPSRDVAEPAQERQVLVEQA